MSEKKLLNLLFTGMFIVVGFQVEESNSGAVDQKTNRPMLQYIASGHVISCAPLSASQPGMVARMKAEAALLQRRQGELITSTRERRVNGDTEFGQREAYTTTLTATSAGQAWSQVIRQWQEENRVCVEVKDRLAEQD